MTLQGTYQNFAIDRVVYGKPAAETVAAESARLGSQRVFLMVSRTLERESTWVDDMRSALGSRYVGSYSGMPTHTPRDAVLEATALARDARPDLVVTFGGGSITDAGKMVRLALKHDIRSIEGFDPFVIRVLPDGTRAKTTYEGADIPQLAVPTTLAGGDFNPSVGANDPRTKLKEIFLQTQLVPRVVVLDPAVTTRTPAWLFLSSGVRALDHAVETVCSPHADRRSWLESMEAMRLLARALPQCLRDPLDLDARMDALLAMWLSMERNRFGLHMGASHGIGHVLGGVFDVPHGYTSCVMLPAVLRWNESVNADRQALVSQALGHPGQPAATVVGSFIASLGMPRTLQEVGIEESVYGRVAEAAMLDYTIYTNPRKISGPADIIEILRGANR
jgi:maleylacetate reductase